MQVTPAAGKYIAGKFKATFDQKRLLSDMPYSMCSSVVGRAWRRDQGLSWLLHHGVRRVQRWPWPPQGMAREVRRSTRPQGRSYRLGGAASRSRRPAITSSTSWKTFRCTAVSALAAPSRLMIEADLRRGAAGRLNLPICHKKRATDGWPRMPVLGQNTAADIRSAVRAKEVDGDNGTGGGEGEQRGRLRPPTASSFTCAATARGSPQRAGYSACLG